ncbi:JDVT-CTERM system glutamic-type intramembrane protease MrtJ [Ideonella livida]|uniref:JDVT-CTERM system CAAX-type protease n=1 Tax=Ideonella livida TaxID=2707176 RepID=A0A7C9PJJ6_9BURK|nr:JDVT-CTERM system glutamic-type intramembrane protease [Ideonella livida]NDY93493.1 JDVT-CTERM system CAAX-type protease [Ideonella livida]
MLLATASCALRRTRDIPPPSAHAQAAWGAALLGLAAAAGLLSHAQPAWTPWLSLLVLAPVLEELVFRAGLQDMLHRRGWSPAAAVLVATAAFTLAHGLRAGWTAMSLATAVPGLLLGGVWARWRRLPWCVGLHAAFNGLWLLGVSPA